MFDRKNRSAFVPLLCVGVVVIGLIVFLTLAPVIDCRWCRGTGFGPVTINASFAHEIRGIQCWECNEGKVPLLNLWSGKDSEP